jgi:hypothetical protein
MAVGAVPKAARAVGHERGRPRRLWLTSLAAFGVLALANIWLIPSDSLGKPVKGSPATVERFELETGVRVVRVAVTAGGGLVDFRYQVINADVATDAVHSAQPMLVDEATGTLIDALFMGHSHAGELKPGYSYPLLYVNADGRIERGGLVSVVIGNLILEHVVVQ